MLIWQRKTIKLLACLVGEEGLCDICFSNWACLMSGYGNIIVDKERLRARFEYEISFSFGDAIYTKNHHKRSKNVFINGTLEKRKRTSCCLGRQDRRIGRDKDRS